MRCVLFVIEKEFLQILRDRSMYFLILLLPMIELGMLPYCATFDIRNIRVYVRDEDHSPLSRLLIERVDASANFEVLGAFYHEAAKEDLLRLGKADLLLHLPSRFSEDLALGKETSLQVSIDAINVSKAIVAEYYLQSVIQDFMEGQQSIALPAADITPGIDILHANWYNPSLDYKVFMVPGILILLITISSGFLTGLSIAREREIGTIEMVNVTPVPKSAFLLGKIIPYWLLGLFQLTLGLLLARFLFDIHIEGSLGLLYLFAVTYVIAASGLGLVISTISRNQLQALLISWFFIIVFILLSGLLTAIENMPNWAQWLTLANPIRYFVEVIRMVMVKGAVWHDIRWHFGGTIILAILLNGTAIWYYRKRE